MRIHRQHARVLALVIAPLAVLTGACAAGPGGGPTCNDTVTTITPGDPGSNPASYPAPGWWSNDTRTNGTVTVNTDLGAPAGFGCTSAKLTTGAANGSPLQDKAQLFSFAQAGTALADINNISYWTNRASSSGAAINLALNVSITGPGVPANFATLVYEPYNQSASQNAIVDNMWQNWNATATTPGDGVWWTKAIPSGPGSQGQPIPWASFQALYPSATIIGYGFNLGSNNPNTVVAGDGLIFGTTTTNF
jgi:hypothetical protein